MMLINGDFDEIPASGNIGLLCLGFEGLLAVRKKREEYYGQKIVFPILNYQNQETTIQNSPRLGLDFNNCSKLCTM